MIKLLILSTLAFFYGCSDSDSNSNSDSNLEQEFSIESSNFANGEKLPERFSNSLSSQCNGNNDFPHLSWLSAPEETQSFVIIVQDPDGSDWVHLNLYNIPKGQSEIQELTASNDPPRVTFPMGTLGPNSWSHSVWEGPCPPSNSGNHRYFFRIYALSRTNLSAPSSQQTFAQFETTYSTDILDYAEIFGIFKK